MYLICRANASEMYVDGVSEITPYRTNEEYRRELMHIVGSIASCERSIIQTYPYRFDEFEPYPVNKIAVVKEIIPNNGSVFTTAFKLDAYEEYALIKYDNRNNEFSVVNLADKESCYIDAEESADHLGRNIDEQSGLGWSIGYYKDGSGLKLTIPETDIKIEYKIVKLNMEKYNK